MHSIMKQNHSCSPPPTSISSSPYSETPNWLDLPRDITETILLKLAPIDILKNAERVCTQWRSITKDPLMWRVIDTNKSFDLTRMESVFDKMCRHAIDRSQGNLVDITLDYFGSNDLLHYIADSASHLQRLRLVCCHNISDEGLSEVVKKLSFLEELDLTLDKLSDNSLEAIGRCCPLLKSLKINLQSDSFGDNCDADAFAIARTMPNLLHLQLVRNTLTNEGLHGILDGCPLLESIDLRGCSGVQLGESFGSRYVEHIKDFLKPEDPLLYDCPFYFDIENWPWPPLCREIPEIYQDEYVESPHEMFFRYLLG